MVCFRMMCRASIWKVRRKSIGQGAPRKIGFCSTRKHGILPVDEVKSERWVHRLINASKAAIYATACHAKRTGLRLGAPDVFTFCLSWAFLFPFSLYKRSGASTHPTLQYTPGYDREREGFALANSDATSSCLSLSFVLLLFLSLSCRAHFPDIFVLSHMMYCLFFSLVSASRVFLFSFSRVLFSRPPFSLYQSACASTHAIGG